ncbi:MAG TPA: Lsr2 family protein [Mycobacteriales bacterium]|nr:Lsr2 family protein [Mycobacteriales bacterium]
MAQKIQVMLVCDVCEGGKPGSETIPFAVDGSSYEIDLCDKHAKGLRDSVASYVGAARRASAGGSRPRGRGGRGSAADRQRTQEIRAWARKKGMQVSERGRLSSEIVAQYEAAHGK